MEMPADSLIIRMLSSIGRIDQTRIRNGKLEQEDWPKLSTAVNKLKDVPLFIDDTPALTPTEVRSRARRVHRENGGLGMVMVDYLQLMQVAGSSEGRTAEISEISRSLKAIAKEIRTFASVSPEIPGCCSRTAGQYQSESWWVGSRNSIASTGRIATNCQPVTGYGPPAASRCSGSAWRVAAAFG
jgi:hypothetical protein